jgi:hypothetical protein
MSAMEALVRTTLTRSFKGDPKALVSLIVIMMPRRYTQPGVSGISSPNIQKKQT